MILSVIVPVYNAAAGEMLEFCIESLMHQTLKEEYEVIFVDDASTDNSLEILYEYQKKYPEKMKVVHREKNGRQGAARNDGIHMAAGEWIGFVDADDWVSAKMYERLLDAVRNNDADIAGGYALGVKEHIFDVDKIDEQNKMLVKEHLKTGKIDFKNLKEPLIKGENMWNKIFHRNVFFSNDLFFPENMFYEDIVFPYFLIKSKKYVLVEEPVYYHYNNLNSTCHTVDANKVMDRLKAAVVLRNTGIRLHLGREWEELLDYMFIDAAYISTLPHIMNNEKVNAIKKLVLLRKMKETIKKDGVDVLGNSYFNEFNGGMCRGWRLFNRSVWLLYLYNIYSRYLKPRLIKKG